MKNNKKIQIILVIIGTILQSFGLVMHFHDKIVLSLICTVVAIIFIVTSFFVLSDKEKKIQNIELNDERNTMIRNISHARTNTIMVFIQTIIAILCVLFKYHILAISFASLVALNGIIVCIIGSQIEKKL